MNGSGGTLYWNTSSTSQLNQVNVEGGGQDINTTTNLAHELKHAHDANFGLGDNRPVNGLKRSEWRASFYENQIRYSTGSPLRSIYRQGGRNISILRKRAIFRGIYVDPPK